MQIQVINWKTELTDATAVWLDKLVYDGEDLNVFLNATINGHDGLFCVAFKERPIFRNIQEEFLVSLWQYISKLPYKVGPTFILENSSWLMELNQDEIFSGTMKNCKHYVVTTNDDIIEVVTANTPQITAVA